MRRLAAVTILVPDYDSGIAFYRDCLGFELKQDRDLGHGKRWVVAGPGDGGADILLARAVNDRQSSAIGNQTGGRVGFFLETDDIARDMALFKGRGVVFEEELRREDYGIVAVFRDPFGNRWDLIKPTAGP